jgi:hypothetical protein
VLRKLWFGNNCGPATENLTLRAKLSLRSAVTEGDKHIFANLARQWKVCLSLQCCFANIEGFKEVARPQFFSALDKLD